MGEGKGWLLAILMTAAGVIVAREAIRHARGKEAPVAKAIPSSELPGPRRIALHRAPLPVGALRDVSFSLATGGITFHARRTDEVRSPDGRAFKVVFHETTYELSGLAAQLFGGHDGGTAPSLVLPVAESTYDVELGDEPRVRDAKGALVDVSAAPYVASLTAFPGESYVAAIPERPLAAGDALPEMRDVACSEPFVVGAFTAWVDTVTADQLTVVSSCPGMNGVESTLTQRATVKLPEGWLTSYRFEVEVRLAEPDAGSPSTLGRMELDAHYRGTGR